MIFLGDIFTNVALLGQWVILWLSFTLFNHLLGTGPNTLYILFISFIHLKKRLFRVSCVASPESVLANKRVAVFWEGHHFTTTKTLGGWESHLQSHSESRAEAKLGLKRVNPTLWQGCMPIIPVSPRWGIADNTMPPAQTQLQETFSQAKVPSPILLLQINQFLPLH